MNSKLTSWKLTLSVNSWRRWITTAAQSGDFYAMGNADRVLSRLSLQHGDPVELGMSGIEVEVLAPYLPDDLAVEILDQMQGGSAHVQFVGKWQPDAKKAGAC